MNEEARPSGGRDRPTGRRDGGPAGARRTPYGIRRDGAPTMKRERRWTRTTMRPMRRSISAPTIAGSWSRARPPTGSASSTRSPASSGSARASPLRGRISEAAIARAVEALLVCRDKMRARGVTRARLIATEACRAAENGEAFRARVAEEAGLELEIVDSATEATLAATGCTRAVRSGRRRRHPVRYRRRLVRAGAARPAERRRRADRRSRRSSAGPRCRSASSRSPNATAAPWCRAKSMTRWWRRSPRFVEQFAVAHRGDLGGFHMLGTSGTVTTIAGVFLRLKRYDRRRVDGCWLTDGEVSRVVDRAAWP